MEWTILTNKKKALQNSRKRESIDVETEIKAGDHTHEWNSKADESVPMIIPGKGQFSWISALWTMGRVNVESSFVDVSEREEAQKKQKPTSNDPSYSRHTSRPKLHSRS